MTARRSAEGRLFTAALPAPELAIARGLVALHGGTVTVTRDAGSLTVTFSITPSSTTA